MKFICPDPDNSLTFLERHKFRLVDLGDWVAMDSDGSWFQYTGDPSIDGNTWECDEEFETYPLSQSSLTLRHFAPEIWQKTKRLITEEMLQIFSEEENICYICDNHGGVHGPCSACGRPAWSKLTLGSSPSHPYRVIKQIKGQMIRFMKLALPTKKFSNLREAVEIVKRFAKSTKPDCPKCAVIEAVGEGHDTRVPPYHFTYCKNCYNIEDLTDD